MSGQQLSDFFNSTGGQVVTALIALFFFLVIVGNLFRKKKFSVPTLTYMAIAIALAVVLSFISIPWAYGGSLSIMRMFCISILGFWFGPVTGVLAGITYGFLDFTIKPYFYTPVQVILDYPLAFGALGLSGLLRKSKYGMYTGFALGAFVRLIFHTISGVVFFSEYAGTQNPIVYSVLYNGSYIVPEVLISMILITIPAVNSALKQMKNKYI